MNSILRPDPLAPACCIPLQASPVRAGFPSPADDGIDHHLDLNRWLVRDQAATYFLRVRGDSMRDAGIPDGALVVVDAGRPPRPGDIVVAEVGQGFTLKRLRRQGAGWALEAAHPDWPLRVIGPDDILTLFGVVTACVITFA